MSRIVVDRQVASPPTPPPCRSFAWRRALVFALLGAMMVIGYGVQRSLSAPDAWLTAKQHRGSPTSEPPAALERRIARRVSRARRQSPRPDENRATSASVNTAEPPASLSPRLEPAPRPEPTAAPGPSLSASADGAVEPPPLLLGEIEVELTLSEVNVLLEHRRTRWQAAAAERGPSGISDLALTLEGDQLVLYAQLTTPAVDLLLGLPFDVRFENGSGVAHLLGARLGELPLPGFETLAGLLERSGDPRLAGFAAKIDIAVDGYPFEPWLELDGERFEVIGAQPISDRQVIVLTLAARD